MLGGDLKINYAEYEKYFEESKEYKELEEDLNTVKTISIEDTYKNELEKQMKKDLEKIGANIEDINLKINLETGEILKMDISVNKEKEAKNTISIDKIEIGDVTSNNKDKTLTKKEIEEIKELLSKNYSIDIENITVNSM